MPEKGPIGDEPRPPLLAQANMFRSPPPQYQNASCLRTQVTSTCCSWPEIQCHQNDSPIRVARVDPKNQIDDAPQLQQACQTWVG
jgi:hypothetical protein